MFFRRQSLFLFIALLSSIGCCLIWNAPEKQESKMFFYITFGVIILGFILTFFSLLKYKHRKIQIILNLLNMIANALLIGLSVYWLLNLSGGVSASEKGIKLLLPAVSFVVLFIANSHIMKDEKLVKSVDRLR